MQTMIEIRNTLVAAGADRVVFQDSFDFLTGVGVEVGDKRHAVVWPEGADKSAEAVEELKVWLVENRAA